MACPSNCNWDFCLTDCDSLQIGRIKVCKICALDVSVDNSLSAKMIKSPSICAGAIISNSLDANNACIGSLGAANACIQNLNAVNAKIVNLQVNDLCIAGVLRSEAPLACDKFGATAVYSLNTMYNLGDLLNFDNVLSDPSGSLSVAPSTYKAPVSGNYIVMIQLDQDNLAPAPGFGPILGVPFANPQVLINGVVNRETFNAYISFFNEQKTLFSALIRLNKDDLVQFKFRVLAISQVSGLVVVPGTVNIIGNGSNDDKSVIKIQLLSVACPTVEPCPPVVPCAPCTPQQCDPSSSPCGPCM